MHKKSRVGTVLKLLLIAAAAVVAVNAFRMNKAQDITQSAKAGSYTNSIDIEGYVIRDETVIETPVTGIIEAETEEGARVAANAYLGAVVTGEIDSELTGELEELTGRIESIKKSMSESGVLTIDDSKIAGTVELYLKNLKYAAAKQNIANLVSLSGDIKILNERRAGLTSSYAAQQNLEELQQRRDAIAASLGGVRTEIYAPKAGVYSKNVDGLENVLTVSSLENITPAKINSFDSLYEGAVKSGLCKIIDNYVWYVAANIPESELDGIEENKSYGVTFKDSGDSELSGTVTYISEPDGEGMCAAVIRFTGFLENFTSLRKVELSLCKAKFSGIYIPTEALRVVGAVTGVYVRNEKTLEFRSVNILYRSEDFVIVEKASEEDTSNMLKLYDNIVINPPDDGKGA